MGKSRVSGVNTNNLFGEIGKAVRDLRWDVRGIIHTDDRISRLPAESRVVTEILQSMTIPRIKKIADQHRWDFRDNEKYGRSYPDMTVITDSERIAIDVKSARKEKGDAISRMTLGTYNGYFLHPKNKILHNKTLCYDDYAKHLIISIVYEWYPDESTTEMVKINTVQVGEKWQFASKTSGSGNTANIGGVDSLQKLKERNGDFKTNNEFEAYWRKYSREHPRRGMQRK